MAVRRRAANGRTRSPHRSRARRSARGTACWCVPCGTSARHYKVIPLSSMHTWMCLLLLVVLGCGSKEKEREPAGKGTGSAPAVVADDSVEIFVDDKSVAKVA